MDAEYDSTDRLADLIAEKLRALDDLAKLARRQRELAVEGSIVGVVEALSAKQPHVDRLLAIERQLDPYREQDPESRSWRSDELRMRTRRISEVCAALLAETLSIEAECERMLTERKAEVATRLDGAQRTDQVRRGYAASAPRRGSLNLSTEG